LGVSQLQNPNSDEAMVTWEQLSASSGMAPNTIRDCYKMMLPYLAVVSALLLEEGCQGGSRVCIAGSRISQALV
jgi:hypothetical protein